MSERLGHKLADGEKPVPGSAAVPREKELCLVVDERSGFSCEFQTTSGDAWLFPYHRLTHAEIDPDGGALRATFSSQEVLVEGTNLDKIKEAIARGRNVLVRAVDVRWKADYKGDDVFVSLVQVTEQPPSKEKTLDKEAPSPA